MSMIATFDFQVNEIMYQTGRALPDVLAELRSMGYTHIEAGTGTVTDEWLETVRNAGLKVALVYTSPDFRDPAANEQIVNDIVACAGKSKTECLMVVPAEYPDLPFDVIDAQLTELAKRLNAINVQMVMEDFDWGEPARSFASSDGLLRYMNAVPQLKCCFDTGNFIRSGENYRTAYQRLKHLVAHVHLKDRLSTELYGPKLMELPDGTPVMSAPVGKGDLDLGHFLEQLAEDGYDGVLALEHGGCTDALTAARESADFLRLHTAVHALFDKAAQIRKAHPEISWGATGVENVPGTEECDLTRTPVVTDWNRMIEPEWSAARKIVDGILDTLPRPDLSKSVKLDESNLWIWGGPTPYWGGSLEDDTLIRGAKYFNIKNAFYVYGSTTEKMIALHSGFRRLLCQVNSNCRAADQIDGMTDADMAELVSRFSLKYPNICGAICDDATQNEDVIDPEPFRIRCEALKKHNPALKMFGVAYAHEMKNKDFTPILPYVDGVNFWFWSMEEILEYDRYIRLCQEKFPGKLIIQGIFIHEYCRSDAGAFPELLEYQLDKAREYLTKGVSSGVILLGDREISKWPDSARAVRNYLRCQ